MTIGESIRRLRREAGLSQEELAEIAQVTNKAVSSWEIGGRTPRLGALRRIASYFHISVSDLLSSDDQNITANTAGALQSGRALPHAQNNHAEIPAPQPRADVRIPLYTTWLGGAQTREHGDATGLSAVSLDLLGTAYITADAATRALVCRALGIPHIPLRSEQQGSGATVDVIVYDTPAAAGHPLNVDSSYERISFPAAAVPDGVDFAVRIFGDSMEPTLHSGTIAFVRKQEQVKPGEIGIFTLDGEAVCKRYAKPTAAGPPQLTSDNSAYSPIDVTQNDVRVLGLVLGTTQHTGLGS